MGATPIGYLVFEECAKRVTPATKRIARAMWKEIEDMDFHPHELECDDALIKLGLARKNPGWTEEKEDEFDDGPVLYKGLDY